MAADVTGCSLPANTSKINFFEAACNGGSDELVLASACGLGLVPSPLRRAQGKAGVGVAFTGMGNCEGCVWGQAGHGELHYDSDSDYNSWPLGSCS